MRRPFAIVAIIAAGGLGFASVAQAHVVYEDIVRYQGAGHCVRVRAEISHGSGNGYNLSRVRLMNDDSACGTPTPVGPGSIRTKFENYVNGAICTAMGPYLENTSTTASLTASIQDAAVCGSGNYHTVGYGDWYNGGWIGGSTNSGQHSTPF